MPHFYSSILTGRPNWHRIVLVSIIMMLCTHLLTAQTITWTGGTSGRWDNPQNWTPNNVPDQVTEFAAFASNAAVNVKETYSIGGLLINSGVSVLLQPDSVDNREIILNDAVTTALSLGAGSVLTLSGRNNNNDDRNLTLRMASAACQAQIAGTIVSTMADQTNLSAFGSLVMTTGTFQWLPGSVYDHNRNGGSINYSATTTWDPTSTLRITGIVGTAPSPITHTTINLGRMEIILPRLAMTFCPWTSAVTLVNLNGNFIIRSTSTTATNYVSMYTGTGNAVINANENFQVGDNSSRSQLTLRSGAAGGSLTFNVGKNMTVGLNSIIVNNVGLANVHFGGQNLVTTAIVTGAGGFNFNVTGSTTNLTVGDGVNPYTLTMARNITINGLFTVSNAATFFFNASGAITFRTFGGMTGAGTVDMSGGSRPHVLTLSGANNTISTLIPGVGTVRYDGGAQQLMGGAVDYYNLEIQGTAGTVKTSSPANSDVRVRGRVDIRTTLNCGTGRLLMAQNATIEREETGLYIGAEPEGQTPTSLYNLVYSNFSTQTNLLTGAEWTSQQGRVRNLTIDVGNERFLLLNGLKHVEGSVIFSSGYLALDAFNLILSDTAVTTGAGSSSYFVTNSTGALVKKGQLSAHFVRTYPLGSGGVYAPVTISSINLTTGGELAIRTVPHRHLTTRKFGVLNRYWVLTAQTGLAVTNWSGHLTHGNGEAETGINGVGYVSSLTSTNWVENPNGASYNATLLRLVIPTNTGLLGGVWTAGQTGPGNTFDVSGLKIAVTDGNWSTPSTWLDGAVPVTGTNVLINAQVTVDQNINQGSIAILRGASLTVGSQNVTTSSDFLVEGTFTDNNTSGTYTITGDWVIGGPVNIGTQTMNLFRDVYFNQEGLNLTGLLVFRGADSYLRGAARVSVNSLQVASNARVFFANAALGVGITMNGTFQNMTGNTTGRYLTAPNGILTLANGFPYAMTGPGSEATDVTNLDFGATGSTVRIVRSAAQTIPATRYYNLLATGAGAKSFGNTPNPVEIQVLNSINVVGTTTLNCTAASADSLILGSRTEANTAYFRNTAGAVNLANVKRMHTVLTSSVPFLNSGTYIFGHLYIRTSGTNPPAISLANSMTIQAGLYHQTPNNLSMVTNTVLTVSGGGIVRIGGSSTGQTTLGNLRVRSANTSLFLDRNIIVAGNSTGILATAGDCALGVENTANTSMNLNGYTLTFRGANNATIVIGDGGVLPLNTLVPGSELVINMATGIQNCVVRSSQLALPIDGFRVVQGNVNFQTPVSLGRQLMLNDTVTFADAITIQHQPLPDYEATFSMFGSGFARMLGNLNIAPASRFNINGSVLFSGSLLTNNSLGVGGYALQQSAGRFTISSATAQTITSPLAMAPMQFNELTIDGSGTKSLPEGIIETLGDVTFGPGPGPLVATGTTGQLIVGSITDPNTAKIQNTGMAVNLDGLTAYNRVIMTGSGNCLTSVFGNSTNFRFGELEFNTTGSGQPPISPSADIRVARNLIHTSDNDFLPVQFQTIRTSYAGNQTTISGNSAGLTNLSNLYVGDGADNSTLTLSRAVSVLDSLRGQLGATGCFVSFAGQQLRLAGLFSNLSNLRFRADQTPGTAALLIEGSGNVSGQLFFEPGHNLLDRFIYNKTGQQFTLAQPIRIEGTSQKRFELLAGTLNNTTHSLSFGTGSIIRYAGGLTTSTSADFTGATDIDMDFDAPLSLMSIIVPPAVSTALRTIRVNPGVGQSVVIGASPRTVTGDVVLLSGQLNATGSTLRIGGNINRVAGALATSATTSLEFNGTVPQVIADDALVNDPAPINNLTISNTAVDGVSMGNQGLTINGELLFTSSPAASVLKTPTDINKRIELVGTGKITGEAPGRYVVGAISTKQLITPGTSHNFRGLGIRLNDVSSEDATVLNSIGGSFEVIRITGRPEAISTGNPGLELNESIARKWIFSPVGALPTEVGLQLNWFADDDNACPSCLPSRVMVFKKESGPGLWSMVRVAGENGRIADADNGDGTRTVWAFTNHFTDYTVGYEVEPLPVTWGAVSARRSGKKVLVSFSTLTEKNNSHFIVLRSVDGKHFSEVGRVEGAGNSASPRGYQFADLTATKGQLYYKIRQVDYDARHDYSPITQVLDLADRQAINLYPNPVKQGQDLLITGLDHIAEIAVIDQTGRVVCSHTLDKGMNLVSGNTLPKQAGIYQLIVKTAETTDRIKLVISE